MHHQIVRLDRSQISTAIEVLGNAFANDSVFRHFFTDRNNLPILNKTRYLSKLMLDYALPERAVYTTIETVKGVAIWIPPDRFPLNDLRLLQVGGYKLPIELPLRKWWQFISLFLKVDTAHQINMPTPHWYLLMLGVHPDYQNQGVGSELIQPILKRADREQMPCYLETSSLAAVRFYRRHGFEVVQTIDFPPENIHIWMMKRESLCKV
jgi:ribosomal protein S18 acetylase RimI-like enzyme